MKILIYDKKFKGGPKVFRNRLTRILQTYPGIDIVTDPHSKFDMELSFVRHLNAHKRINIIRVDGCYIEMGHELKNRIYKDSMKKSQFVIYQSKFSKKMIEHILKINKPNTIIHNGIDLEDIEPIEPHKEIHPGSFVACSLWRSNKRPLTTIESFLEASIERHLYIIGSCDDCPRVYKKYKNEPYIHFLGKLDFQTVISIFKACQYQIHIPYIDSCPNSVVEGLACGLNVLSSNLGGSSELIRNDGVIVNIDKWDLVPKNSKVYRGIVDTKDDRSAIKDKVSEGIHNILKKNKRANRTDLDIRYVADKYIQVFKQFASLG